MGNDGNDDVKSGKAARSGSLDISGRNRTLDQADLDSIGLDAGICHETMHAQAVE